MTAQGELLELACRRIEDLDRPAYIKNSELRYVAVNVAYARFFDRNVSDFIGQRSADFGDSDPDCEDKERRAIVFGSEEIAVCVDPVDGRALHVQIESFSPAEGRAYVFGLFQQPPTAPELMEASTGRDDDGLADLARIRQELEKLPHPICIFAEDGRRLVANAAFRNGNPEDGVAQAPEAEERNDGEGVAAFDSVLAESALDLMNIGVCIYNERDELMYQNEAWRKFYRPVIGDVPLGASLRWICEKVFDYWQAHYPAEVAAANLDRDVWVARRLLAASKPHQDSVERLLSGRWLRSINKRLPNGLLIGLRIDVTEMKDQEQLLHEHIGQIDLYRRILEDLPVAAFVRDVDHRMIYSNEAYSLLTGLSREEVAGKTEADMFGSQAEMFFQQNEQILVDGDLLEFDEDFVDRWGVARPVITRANRVMISDEKRYVVGSMIDISTLKQREAELIEAQGRAELLHRDFENILRAMPAGVLILDAALNVEYTNDAFYQIWDFPKDMPLIGRSFRELFEMHREAGLYDDDSRNLDEIYRSRIDELADAGDFKRRELSFGPDKTVILDFRRISSDRMLLFYADISSARKGEREVTKAREALEQLGELMRDTTHVMSQGLCICKGDEILLCNDALVDMLRLPVGYVTEGANWTATFEYCAARGDFGDEWEKLLAGWQQNVKDRKPISAVFQVAGERWMQLEATISESERWIAVITDVTDIKEREEELQRLLNRSEAADRAKSEFLANMSHEIRTPMNGVLGMAELLAKTDLDPRQKTFTDIIVKSGNTLLTIINDILDFSKIDAGQMALRKAPFDPVDAVEDIASLMSAQAAEKDIELMVRVAPEMPHNVVGDAGRFRQIVTNLVGNAIKFTERGHILIDMGWTAADSVEPLVTLDVTDTGIGIPAEKLDTIFDKFSQVDGSSTRRHEGTGLGLAITAGLVDLFGGYLGVESEWGMGSTFTVHLPLPPAATRREAKAIPVNVKGARILVIDDNEVNRRILSEQLKMWHFDGFAAENGPTGLAILDHAFAMGLPVDAVILDYQMPDMNGAAVARAIRGDSRFDNVSLIFLTSMDVAGGDKEFAALSGQAHLMKPTRANVLRNTIIDVVRTARRPRGPETEETAAVEPRRAAAIKTDADSRPAPAIAESRTAFTSVHSIDILVAEDNEVNQIVFTQILQATKLRFLVVNNGREAVRAWQQLRPALILMDVSMPVMNGHQATETIRRIEEQTGNDRRTPIVGVTAHALESDRERCLEVGMDDYMSKPISPELLEAKIRRWLGGSAAVSEGSRS